MREEEQEIYFTIEDEQGISHTLRLLSIFNAGHLNRQYVAAMTCDIMLYKCDFSINRVNTYIAEILDEIEYERVVQVWGEISENGVEESSISERTVFMRVSSVNGYEDISFEGTVYGIFSLDERDPQQYIAICPHNIMFFRYNLNETEGAESVEISNIYSPQEYEDVALAFHNLLVE